MFRRRERENVAMYPQGIRPSKQQWHAKCLVPGMRISATYNIMQQHIGMQVACFGLAFNNDTLVMHKLCRPASSESGHRRGMRESTPNLFRHIGTYTAPIRPSFPDPRSRKTASAGEIRPRSPARFLARGCRGFCFPMAAARDLGRAKRTAQLPLPWSAVPHRSA